MLSLFCNLTRGHLSHTIKCSSAWVRKYASTAAVLEIPMPEKNTTQTIIKCKHAALNFYAGQTYDKFMPVPLASKGWRHHKAVNDYFILYPDGGSPDASLTDTEITSFEESDLNRQLIANLRNNDLIKPSRIQSIAIPVLLSGKNTIIAAETGCGKTLAYLLPLFEQIIRWKSLTRRNFNEPLGLIISPSRDLTQQLGYVAKKVARDMDINIRVVVGGRTKQLMMNPTVDEVDLLIGSFGAVSKLTTTSVYNMAYVRHVVLEEADTLLDDSFTEKLRHFLKKIRFSFAGPESGKELPKSAQMTLVSATMPTCLPEALEEIIDTDSLVRLTTDNLHRIMPSVAQKFIRINRSSRAGEILKIAKGNSAKKHQTIIFCNTVKTCEWLYLFLTEMGINCCCTHGDVRAELRTDKFIDFQNGNYTVLVTTDACSRGLDTVHVRHVVNFDFPLHTADYIHRCGRTGRLGSHENCYVTNFISSYREIELVQKMESSIRNSTALPNVNANITKIIKNKIEKDIQRTQRLMNEIDAPPPPPPPTFQKVKNN